MADWYGCEADGLLNIDQIGAKLRHELRCRQGDKEEEAKRKLIYKKEIKKKRESQRLEKLKQEQIQKEIDERRNKENELQKNISIISR